MPTVRSTRIRGARMHNLQGIDCEIPRGKITVITGVSGSGKSTLAFDVLYAEGQRRFVECLSAYARQFMERLERPEVDEIGEIQPPIALKQRVSIQNARSTVGSITELSDYFRMLFVHASEQHCLQCGGPIERTGIAEAIDAIRRWPEGTRLAIVAPLPELPSPPVLERLRALGFSRILWGDDVLDLDELPAGRTRSRAKRKRAGLVIDRIESGKTRRGRLAEAIELAWKEGQGICWLHPLEPAQSEPASRRRATGRPKHAGDVPPAASDARDSNGGPPRILRRGRACRTCGTCAPDLLPALFSWNSPLGACPECQGFGRIITVDRAKVVPDPRKNLRNHAVVPFSVPSARAWYRRLLREAVAREIPTDVPWSDLTPDQQDWVFRGDRRFPGVEGFFKRRERKRYKMHVRIFIARFRGYERCPACGGSRLRREALAATVGGKTIDDLHQMPIGELGGFLDGVTLTPEAREKVQPLLESIALRLRCLEDVGVGYLTLARSGRTLSGGETQRIRIAAALGNSLTDTLFVLDEPTVGLHALDTQGMLRVLRRLSETGNTVVVVEHDAAVIEAADHLILLGPGGGRDGGRVIYEGPPGAFLALQPEFFVATEVATAALPPIAPAIPPRSRELRAAEKAVAERAAAAKRRRHLRQPWDDAAVSTWLHEHAAREVSRTKRPAGTPSLTNMPALRITHAREHNLKIPKLTIPLTGLVVISGVSGSGKSTLLDEIIYRNFLRASGRPVEGVGHVAGIDGLDTIHEAQLVGQELLGRSSRSNPISFVQAYSDIRALLANTIAARQRKLAPGAFSFNTVGGRCETCRGMGTQTLEMYFLPDVEVPCEACAGKRFRPGVLEVAWRGKNIDEILGFTVDEAAAFFASEPKIVDRLSPLRQVGLGYITLGQSTASLSGGEGQRLKLAAFLASASPAGRHLFLFDEPTTGLHARDIKQLLAALRALLARGHAIIAVEHQLDFIRAADWVIDLGPGPGDAGGRVVFSGPVGLLGGHATSATARALREHEARIAAWRHPTSP